MKLKCWMRREAPSSASCVSAPWLSCDVMCCNAMRKKCEERPNQTDLWQKKGANTEKSPARRRKKEGMTFWRNDHRRNDNLSGFNKQTAFLPKQALWSNHLALIWGYCERGNSSASLRNKINQSNKPADLSKGYSFAINKWKKNSINLRLAPCLKRKLLLYHSMSLLPSTETEECFSWYLCYWSKKREAIWVQKATLC